jgi:hypothetical protein
MPPSTAISRNSTDSEKFAAPGFTTVIQCTYATPASPA